MTRSHGTLFNLLLPQRFNVQVELTEAAELIDGWRPNL